MLFTPKRHEDLSVDDTDTDTDTARAECPWPPPANVSMGMLTRWRPDNLLTFLPAESVHEVVIGSRMHIDWGSAASVAKVGARDPALAICH
jgi:hypothetical protein